MPARRNRVTQGADYRQIVRKGNRVGGAYCITHAVFSISAETDITEPTKYATSDPGRRVPARFGFIISKAVGNAVTRNLIRRRMKTIADRRIAAGYNGVDVVFRALPAVALVSFEVLESEVNSALDKLERKRPQSAKASRIDE